MGDDVIFAKPSFLGFGLDLRVLWRRLSLRNPKGPSGAAARFLRLFADHRVPENQIPLLIPGISLNHLVSPSGLVAGLSSDSLEAACNLFGVRSEWIRCVDERIYETKWSYKCPENFFAALESLKTPAEIAPVRAFATDNHLDNRRGVSQRIEIVLVEDVARLGELRVERYTPFSDGRDWACADHRVELKSIVRAYGKPVPLFRCSSRDINALYNGEIVPRKMLSSVLLTDPSLEDWCMSKSENWHAKEIEELEQVIDMAASLKTRRIAPRQAGQ